MSLYYWLLAIIIVCAVILLFWSPLICLVVVMALGLMSVGLLRFYYGRGNDHWELFKNMLDFRSRSGFKSEWMSRFLLNKYVSQGRFISTNGIEDIMPFLYSTYQGPRHYIELDGYNSALNVAFEYNGATHYNKPDKTEVWQYCYKINNDRIKKYFANKGCYKLIILHCGILHDQLDDYIKSRLLDLGILGSNFKCDNYVEIIEEPEVIWPPEAYKDTNCNDGRSFRRFNNIIYNTEIKKKPLLCEYSGSGMLAEFNKRDNPEDFVANNIRLDLFYMNKLRIEFFKFGYERSLVPQLQFWDSFGELAHNMLSDKRIRERKFRAIISKLIADRKAEPNTSYFSDQNRIRFKEFDQRFK